jgi:hypothetical protein
LSEKQTIEQADELVGFRLAAKNPVWWRAFYIQNDNAYKEQRVSNFRNPSKRLTGKSAARKVDRKGIRRLVPAVSFPDPKLIQSPGTY